MLVDLMGFNGLEVIDLRTNERHRKARRMAASRQAYQRPTIHYNRVVATVCPIG